MATDRVVRIANGQGFWGDSVDAPVQLIEGGALDYLTLDYLAEVTMSIMQKQRSRNPDRGYATDFVDLIRRTLPQLRERAWPLAAALASKATSASSIAIPRSSGEYSAGARLRTTTGLPTTGYAGAHAVLPAPRPGLRSGCRSGSCAGSCPGSGS